MDKFVVVADDLTGGNGTGVLLVKDGLKVFSAVNYKTVGHIDLNSCNGVVVNTCSRGIPAEEAFSRVFEVTATMREQGVTCFCKRIDSTIRGNLGIEIEAALTALGDEYVAMVVPVWPQTGRINVGGYLLVNGMPVQQTDAGVDAKTPVRSSSVAEVIAAQTTLPIGLIPLNKVLAGQKTLIYRIKTEAANGKRIIIFDAVSDGDIANIAEAVKETGLKIVAVDPGPFSEAIILSSLGKAKAEHKGKVMVVSGSATALTRAQLDYLQQEYKARLVNVDVKDLLDGSLSEEQENKLARQVHDISKTANIFGLRVAAEKQMVIDLASVA
ncbi:MAG TPA: four-carbon acid sugar kinase family protein, partial [Desulfobacteria bacterium]|nr:four-carbon acid sugar kinase family protein [Desulfobacteria bacterium]